MLTAHERHRLRDRIARESVRRGIRNPLVTTVESTLELDLLSIINLWRSDPDNWAEHGRAVYRFNHDHQVKERV
jgi:hypothetical protein